jgi:hypothetical protein
MTTPTADLPLDPVRALLEDPPALVGHSAEAWNNLPREVIDDLQLRGLQERFATLRDAIPVVRKLADGEGIDSIDTLDDVVPLLFEHTVYKSYPPSLLTKRSFGQVNRWLARLVTPEVADQIAAADVSACGGLDDWFTAMDRQVPGLRISHTSGTSGTLSFLPHGTREWEKIMGVRRMIVNNTFAFDPDQAPPHAIFPYYRYGYLSHLRGGEFTIDVLLGGREENFHAAYPVTLSSDVLHLAAQLRSAQAKGTLDRLEIPADLQAKKAEYDRVQAEMPEYLPRFFAEIVETLKGERIYVAATWNHLHNMARAGLSAGLEGVFAPDSFVQVTGGAKGMPQPEGWQEDILRFTGVSHLNEAYQMSEVLATHSRCEEGHFHFGHTAIPFLLDPSTSRPLPRTGRVTGRAAFFDLGAETRWGGFITGDEITIEWDEPCPCGRPSRYVVGAITRYSEKDGGDDKITCAASEASHREAMEFLNALTA